VCVQYILQEQMHFGFMDVILLHSGRRQHVSATHVAIFRVVRKRIHI